MFSLVTRMAIPALRQQSARQFSFVALQSTTPMQSRMATKPTSALSSYLLNQSAQSPTSTYSSSIIISQLSPLSGFLQRRWGTRGGNRGATYQPSTLKRKRRLGFLARMRSRTGRRIVKARRDKGRWFLTY